MFAFLDSLDVAILATPMRAKDLLVSNSVTGEDSRCSMKRMCSAGTGTVEGVSGNSNLLKQGRI